MTRRKQHRTIGYYVWRIVLAFALVGGIFYYAPKIYARFQYLPIDKILANSVLKDRTFQAEVKEIKSGDVRAYLLEEHTNPIVSISFAFQNAGTAYEPENKFGLALMLTEMLTAGGAEYDAKEFKNICAEHGIKIDFSVSADNFSGTLQFPKEFTAKAVEMFKAALYTPRFDETYLALVKKQQLLALQAQQERPEQVLATGFKKFIFAGHPYERDILGAKQDVLAIETADLDEYRQKMLAQNNLLVGIAGDVTADEAQQLLAQLFADLPLQASTEKLAALSIETSGEKQAIIRHSAQVVAKFAVQGTFRNSVDFYPLYLVNYIFGESGLTSRLNQRIREKEGLTYGVYTYLMINRSAALIAGGFSATPDNFTRAIELLRQEWQRLGLEGVSEEELAQAKKALIEAYNLRFASTEGIADMLLAMQVYDLGIDFLQKRNDYIKEVTLQEANAAAKKYFSQEPDLMYIGILEKEEKN